MTDKIIWDFDALKEGKEFVGEVTGADWEDNTDMNNRPVKQLHLQVKPLDHEVHGIKGTGNYHEWFTFSDRKNSKWGIFTSTLKGIGVFVKSEKDLVGKKFVFTRKTLDFGEEISKAKDVLLPLSSFTGTIPPVTAPTAAPVTVSTETKRNWDELHDTMEKMGMTEKQIRMWCTRNGISMKEVNEHMALLEADNTAYRDGDTWYVRW